MSELSERQRFILTLVIHEHIRKAAPVGSEGLVKDYQLDISPATVRNEMAALTEMGYLRQPHTSAGRVPSEEGYRFFVSRMLQNAELPDTTRRMISHQFYQTRHDVEEWMRLAASILAHQSKLASLITSPHPDRARLKHLELISTRGKQVLMVLVMHGGEIHQRLLTLTEPATQEELSSTSRRITGVFEGKNALELTALYPQMQGIDQEVVERVMEEMSQADAAGSGEVYLDGLMNVLSEPEFSGSDDGRRALHVLEERSLLHDLLSRTVMNSGVGGVQVLIGWEGTWDELRQCSVVLACYGSPGVATGTLGILGPIRMSYGRAISTVRFLSGILTDMVSESLGE